MSLTRIPPERSHEWNTFVAASRHPSILQSYEWGTVKSGTWQPIPVAKLDDRGRFTACSLLLKRPLPLGQSILYAPRGPVLSEWNPDLAERFLREVRDLAAQERAFLVQFDPEIPETDADAAQLFLRCGLCHNPENIQPRGTILLNLRPESDALLASFHHKTRYNIRLAEKKGVKVHEENTEQGVKTFYRLFQKTAERDHFMILRESYFSHLWKTLAPEGMLTILVASYEDRPLAAIVNTIFGGRMIYMYGASSGEHRNLMPNHLLHWRAIEWARQRGVHTYDLWGVPAHPREGQPLWGVYRFKKGFCETETRWIGTYQMVRNSLWYRAFKHGSGMAKSAIRFIRTGRIRGSLDE